MQYINGPSLQSTRLAGSIDFDAFPYCSSTQPLPLRIRSALGAWNLLMTEDWTLLSWCQPVLDEVEARYSHNESTFRKLTSNITDLYSYLAANDINSFTDITDGVISDWVEAPGYDKRLKASYDPALTTMRNRRWAALVMLTTAALLGAPIDPFALIRGTVIIDDAGRKTKLLTDTQLQSVRDHADPRTIPSRRSVIAALSTAGAKPADMAHVCLADIDFEAGTVTLGPPGDVRVNLLDSWARRTIKRRIAHSPPASPHEPLCVKPTTTTDRAVRSIRTQLSQLLRQAGIGHIDGISGMSIRYTAARKCFETHGIEAAAVFLGVSSLDTAAAAVGHSWRSGDG